MNRLIIRAGLVLTAGLFALTAVAQVRPDAGTLLERERPPLPGKPPAELMPQAPRRPALAGDPKLKVTVRAFRITGNTVLSEAELLKQLRDFVGKELDFKGLNEAADRIRDYYRQRGYFLAQAYLPQQDLREGVVEIAVLEGRVGKVSVNLKPGTTIRQSFVEGILHRHIREGDLLTETGLERPLLLVNDLPNATVRSFPQPGAAVGTADVVVEVGEEGGPINGFGEVDNHGNRFTGEYRIGGLASANNLTGYGDVLTFRGSLSDAGTDVARLNYVIPVGYYGTRLGVSYSQLSYRLGKDFAPLRAHGVAHVGTLYALHPFIRTRNVNLFLQIAAERKSLKDRVDSTSTVEDRTIDSGKFALAGDFRDQLGTGGLNSYSIGWTRGELDLSPLALRAADQAPATGLATEGVFDKVNLDYRRLQRLTDHAVLLFTLAGQRASKNLASAEKMTLGGPNAVRAYPVGEAAGDDGVLVNLELRYTLPAPKIGGGDLTLLGFYDAGRVRQNHRPLATVTENIRSISGYGLGLNLGREGDFVIRTSLAWRANEPPRSDVDRLPRVWLHALKWF